MKKHFFITLVLFALFAVPAQAQDIQIVWDKYFSMVDTASKELVEFPGRIIGDVSAEHKEFFTQKWKMRSMTYEIYFASSQELAQNIYQLAIFAKDISKDFPKEKFLKSVLGFHYNNTQILAWANSLYKKEYTKKDYPSLISLLLDDAVLTLSDTGFAFSQRIKHVLAAAAGKKRSFEANLEHERLHVFWDEDDNLREKQIAKWHALSDEQKKVAKEKLHQYAKENEAQLIEEWSIHSTEKSNFNLF